MTGTLAWIGITTIRPSGPIRITYPENVPVTAKFNSYCIKSKTAIYLTGVNRA